MEELQKKKFEIEDEVNKIMEFLNSCGTDVGLKGKLVDSEGFPRSDVDIYEIRKARNRFAVLNTDYTNLMKEIEAKLYEIHKNTKFNAHNIIEPSNDCSNTIKYPFGYVDLLLDDSPASLSGIKKGDILIGFGGICTEKELTSQEESKLLVSKLTKLVLDNIDKCIEVNVLRSIDECGNDQLIQSPNLSYSSIDMNKFTNVSLKLTPRKWEGHGFLGCHIAYLHRKLNNN